MSVKDLFESLQERELVTDRDEDYDSEPPQWISTQGVTDFGELPPHRMPPRPSPEDREEVPRREESGEDRLDDTERQILRRAVEVNGTEALAWYRPYHTSPSSWGIYIREMGRRYIADYLERQGVPSAFSLYHADKKLLDHEKTHFFVEAVCSRQELLGDSPIYQRRHEPSKTMVKGLPLSHLEEALCNANAVYGADSHVTRQIERFAKTRQPSGYKDWDRVAWRTDFQEACEEYLGHTANQIDLNRAPWYPIVSWARGQSRHVDVRIVPPEEDAGLGQT